MKSNCSMKSKYGLFVAMLLSVLINSLSIAKGQTVDELNNRTKQLEAEIREMKAKLQKCQRDRRTADEAEKSIRILQKENDSLKDEIESIRTIEEARSKAEANAKLVKIDSDIKDPVFLEYLLKYCDMDNDGVLTQWDANHTYVIDIGKDKSLLNFIGTSNQITSIEGIEHFVNLKRLVCSGNSIPQMNLSKNTLIETFVANGCELKILDVSKNDRLTHLECSNNLLNTIDLKNHPNLQILDVSNNKMAAINISGCYELKTFNCSGNELTSLDVSKNVALQTLDCSNNKINKLSFTSNIMLDNINCSKNKLTDVDVRNGILEMKFFDCSKNKDLEFVYFSKGCRIPPENDKRDVRTYYK